MNLFVPGRFVGVSGRELSYKIECDALTAQDWECLAVMAVSMLPGFGEVEAVPRGGVPFADALREHVTPGVRLRLLADDVWTTGASMTARRAPLFREVDMDWPMGVVAFSRARFGLPSWCRAVLTVDSRVAP